MSKKAWGELWAYKMVEEPYHRFVIKHKGRVYMYMDNDFMPEKDANMLGVFRKYLGRIMLSPEFNK